jgi:hypothetical protein
MILPGWLRFLRRDVHWVLTGLRLVERGRAEVWRRARVIRGGGHRLRE